MKSRGHWARWVGVAAIVAALGVSPALATGSPRGSGSLDRTYAKNGIFLRDFGTEPDRGGADEVLSEEDGSSILLTSTFSSFCLTKVGPDGAVDRRFGHGGFTPGLFGIATGDAFAQGMAAAPGGKILVFGSGGEPAEEHSPFALSRYLPDGRLDRGFGSGGSTVFEGSPPVESGATAAVTLRGGATLVFGRHAFALGSGFERFEAVRLRRDGTVDRSFGHRGFLVFPASHTSYGLPTVATLGPDGRPLVLLPKNEGGYRLFRFRPDGEPDPTFGRGGVVEGSGVKEAGGLALGPGGEIVVTGPDSVATLSPEGSPVATFPIPVLPEIQSAELKARPAVDAAGRILLGGDHVFGEGASQAVVVRLRPDGSLDPEFGEGRGFVAVPSQTGTESAIRALASLPDGRVLAVGADDGDGSLPGRSLALRLGADGRPDGGFGTGGTVSFQARVPARAEVTGLAVAGNGSAVAGGTIKARLGLAALRPDGSPDRGFAKAGVALGPGVGSYGVRGRGIARTSDGRLLVGGGTAETGAMLARYLPGGRPDSGFGEGGIAQLPALKNVLAVQLLGDGSILAAGRGPSGVSLVRLHPDGRPDRAFGRGGSLRVPGALSSPNTASLALAAGGRILVACASNRESTLIELSSDGRPVSAFGHHGRLGLRDLPDDLAALRVDREGRIVAAGTLEKGFLVERIRPDGSLDPSFGTGGQVRTAPEAGARDAFADLALEPDGDVVAAGTRELGCGFQCVARVPTVFRYRPDGSPDPSFGHRGVWSMRIGQSAGVTTVALAGDRILVGGWEASVGGGNRLMVLALRR